MENNNCRMYEKKFPDIEDLVVVQVKNVNEVGAYVVLLEYNNIEGMILLSELSRRRIRSINKLIRVGRTEIVVVLRVDKEKGYIDLSKRRVSVEDIAECEKRYKRGRAVHSIMRHVSETCQVRVEKLYEDFGWPLYKKYGHAYDAFKLAVQESEAVLGSFELSEEIKKQLLLNITRRLTPQPVRIRAEIEVSCFSYEGIDAIKKALLAGIELKSDPPLEVMIKLVAPPMFVVMTTALDKDYGIKHLQAVCDKIKEVITPQGGSMNIKEPPRAISDRDDQLLNALMERMEKQNREVAGDEAEEEHH